MDPAMLEVHNLDVRYGAISAVRGVSFTVEQGQVVCLLGANGAGKTTTLLTISGLLKAHAGSIHFDGQDITGMKPEAIVRLGLIQAPEGRHVFPRLMVRENLELGAYCRTDRAAIRSDLDGVLDRFPRLRERIHQSAGTLSGGEQQMLAIGRALMARPRLLLLDEPSLGLAPLIATQILETVRSIADSGITVLLVEQNARAALALADRGLVFETGRLVIADSAEALAVDPALTAAYLGG
jgi:branched-chain amino acid transport system ATP-binding protein